MARWGGDEFIVVLNCELAAAKPQINRIREWVLGDYSIHAGSDKSLKVDIDASIGVAQWLPGKNVKQVIEQADAAMYLDKKQSRKRRLCEPQPGVPHGQHGVCAAMKLDFLLSIANERRDMASLKVLKKAASLPVAEARRRGRTRSTQISSAPVARSCMVSR